MLNQVNCYSTDGQTVEKTLKVSEVFKVPVRSDLIQDAFRCLNMAKRQPYAVSPLAGMQHSAHSWGTGRAMARVPRVSGGGTRRSGQAAFANFARKGRLAHPTKVTRRWQRKFNRTAKRHAIAMGIAASAVPALLQSRGHRIESLKSVPLVISNQVKEIKKTKEAVKILQNFGLKDEIEKVKENITLRPGKGKARNRRYLVKKGLLIVYKEKTQMIKAFRNIKGVELVSVDNLDLIKLCPGGQAGRLILWLEEAFEELNNVYSSYSEEVNGKKGYFLPNSIVSHDDVESIFYSEKVQNFIDVFNLLPGTKAIRDPKEITERYSYIFN
ncbi:60S ribosomal L4 [Tubulinosema ratisbonensis]|uniref:Large ribosomal subunit protein uL4 n=1 Tax=Tubulinosema ratisbonensis TaxID=291195 RepID=A0A437AJC5_9MICR|nr:60S ribosomal L4 [Tubulinosema ratisbonensis]